MESGLTTHQLSEELDQQRGSRQPLLAALHAVERIEYSRQHLTGYLQRHAFKPGITGLAQVEGWRGETSSFDSMAARIDTDLRYQRNWSLKLDIKILIKTLLHLRSPNAY